MQFRKSTPAVELSVASSPFSDRTCLKSGQTTGTIPNTSHPIVTICSTRRLPLPLVRSTHHPRLCTDRLGGVGGGALTSRAEAPGHVSHGPPHRPAVPVVCAAVVIGDVESPPAPAAPLVDPGHPLSGEGGRGGRVPRVLSQAGSSHDSSSRNGQAARSGPVQSHCHPSREGGI